MNIWSALGIEPTDDLSEIKRAYARQLKTTRPDQDPEGYQRLREAFDIAKKRLTTESISDVVTPEPAVEMLRDGIERPSLTRMPILVDPLTELTPETDDALEQELDVISHVPGITDALMRDESEGLNALNTFLSSELMQNLRLREIFSQALAEALSEREGLYDGLLSHVSTRMAWDIDHYKPEGISEARHQALLNQIEHTAVNGYWDALCQSMTGSALDKERLRLLTVEGATLPWWARLVPDFVHSLNEKIAEIRMRSPVLMSRVNSRLPETLAETHVALRWGALFLTAFWLLLIVLGTREAAQPVRNALILTAIIGIYVHGYAFLERILRIYPRMLAFTEGVLSVMATGVLIKIGLGLSHLFKPASADTHILVSQYVVLSVMSFFVLWLVAPKKWNWYAVPLNVMAIVVTFPWRLMRKTRGAVSVVAFVLVVAVYALMIAFLQR